MIIKRDRLFTPAGTNRRLHIYLPDNYYWTDERYPVMYFFDGHNLFFNEDATFGKSWGLKEYLDYWHKKMIIVGIECSHEGNQRLQEYCPYVYTGKFWGVLHGTGKETLVWMTEELKPDIDREFRTYAFREATGIAGSSMGGLMALYGVVMHKKMIAVHSVMNKVTGALLFALPFMLGFLHLQYSAIVICAAATFAAIQEGHYIRTGRVK